MKERKKQTNVTLNDILDIDIIVDLIHPRQVQLNFLTFHNTNRKRYNFLKRFSLSVDYK